jgi:predicted transcriptional regulator
MTNSARFINAYNKIDSCLRNIYNISAAVSFSDLIRRCAEKNYIVRSNETVLQDYARLRNAIVHKSTEEIVIAEPHDSVAHNIERLATLICTPPRATSVFAGRKVITIKAGNKLKDAIVLMRQSHYSNIPVYKDNQLIGILNNKIIVHKIGGEISEGRSVDRYLASASVEDVLEESYFDTYYRVCGRNTTIDNISEYFNSNRKLIAVIITENGMRTSKPLCIITTYDITEINRILDNYQEQETAKKRTKNG